MHLGAEWVSNNQTVSFFNENNHFDWEKKWKNNCENEEENILDQIPTSIRQGERYDLYVQVTTKHNTWSKFLIRSCKW